MKNAAQKVIRLDDIDVYVQKAENIFHSQKPKHFLFSKEKCDLCDWIEKNTDLSQTVLGADFYIYKNTEYTIGSPSILLYKHHVLKSHERILHYILSLADNSTEDCVLYDGTEIDDKHKKHFYLQTIDKNKLPVIKDCEKEKYSELIYQNNNESVHMLKNYLRSGFLISGKDFEWIFDCFEEVEKQIGRNYSLGKFPYLNLIAWKESDFYNLLVFPRVVHRPSQYYAHDSTYLNIEPGAADLGGCILAYSDEVFNRLDSVLIRNIYQQITFNPEKMKDVVNKFVYP